MSQPDPSRSSLFDLLLARWDEEHDGTPTGATPPTTPGDDPRWRPARECLATLEATFAPASAAGVPFGRFVLRRELGRGGFGVVFLADDPDLGRPVALKVPRPEFLLDPERKQRFLTEARAVAALDHPNIVAVHEAGETNGVAYLAMAYCPGPTLAAWLKDHPGPVPPRDAASLVATLADAMQHAHSRGVLHRDLKPGNVLLNRSEERGVRIEVSGPILNPHSSILPKIADFGLAKRLDDDPAQTRTGAVLGTPAYMAPEQAAGRSHEVGTHSDIYSLGAILYELIAGRPPFAGTGAEVLARVLNEEPAAPRRLNPAVPRDLETVCLKCLAKEPGRRYGSAGELAADLRRWTAGEGIAARPAGVWERLLRWGRRNPALVTAAGLLLVTLVATAGAGAWGVWKYTADLQDALVVSEGHRREAEQRLADVDDAAALIQSFSADCRNGLFEKARDAANRSIENFRRVIARNPRGTAGKRSLALSHEVCGACWCGLEDYGQAVEQFREALAIYKELKAASPNSYELTLDTFRALDYLIGAFYVWRGHDDDVVRYATELIAIRRAVFDGDRRNRRETYFLFENMFMLGDYLLVCGRAAEARLQYDRAQRYFNEAGLERLDLDPGVEGVIAHRLALVNGAGSPGFDGPSAIAGHTDHNEFCMRLQLDLKDRGDYVRLATVSDILARRQFPFRVVYVAARGFADAANLAPPSGTRDGYDRRCIELIAKLYNFNNRVGDRLRREPSFHRHMHIWQQQQQITPPRSSAPPPTAVPRSGPG